MKNSWVPEAVIYDMDGVLIDSEPLWKEAEISAFNKIGIDFTLKECEKTVGLRIDEVVDFWLARNPESKGVQEEVVQDIMNNMVSLINKRGKALPGVYSSLAYFHSKGLKIGLATSSYEILMNTVLKKLDISNYFEVTRSAEKEVYGKPHPAVYISTAKKLAVSPEDCLVIEDSFNGMLAGLAAKMKVLVVPEKSHQVNDKLKLADYHLDSLDDLKTIF